MVLQPLLVQQITPGEPHPFVDDPPDVRETKLLRDVLVMGPDVLERILSHETLEVPILLDDMGGVEIINICALHAERDEKLTTYKESTPALHCEWYALVLRPKSVAKLIEANFLDDLETVDRAAPLAVRFELLGDEVTNHSLESHGLSSKREPQAGQLLNRLLR